MAKLTSVHWQHVRALRAEAGPYKVAALQPVGELTTSDELGPHYLSVEGAIDRSRRLVDQANSAEADLVLAPEYSIPPEFVSALMTADAANLRNGVVYVLPMSTMPLSTYDAFSEHSSAEVDVTLGELVREDGRASVNACAILTRSADKLHALFQAKVVAAPLEETAMVAGAEVFAIEGAHMCLSVATCADLNLSTHHDLWCEALARKSGGILFHPQWNPAPDFQTYETFWRESLGHQDGTKRMIFALNWAGGSRISTSHMTVRIECGRSKVLRGRAMEAPSSLRQTLSLAGMNAHRWAPGGGSTRFEIWHVADGGDTVWIWEFVRPFTNQTPPTVPRQAGLRSASLDRWDENGPVTQAQLVAEQTRAFWAAAAAEGVELQDYPALESATPFDIDRLCSACRMREENEWLETDPTERPSSPLECTQLTCAGCDHAGRQCSRGRESRYEAIRYTASCIFVFAAAPSGSTHNLRVSKSESYPLNLSGPGGEARGWLLHGRGRAAREIEKDATRLIGARLLTAERPIYLFVFQADGDVDPAQIGQHNIDGEDPGTQDILNPEHGREVLVQRVERRDS